MLVRRPARTALSSWQADARAAIVSNPDYFVWWYTVKSIALCGVAAVAAYYIGKDVANRGYRGPR